MDIKIEKKDKKEMKIELSSEDHTFVNLLRKTLWEDEYVKNAAYRMEHPLTGKPLLKVETGRENADTALEEAARKIGRRASRLQTLFEENIK